MRNKILCFINTFMIYRKMLLLCDRRRYIVTPDVLASNFTLYWGVEGKKKHFQLLVECATSLNHHFLKL